MVFLNLKLFVDYWFHKLNDTKADWFVEQLENLKDESKINSFKFDAGEVNWLSKKFNMLNASISPDEYSMGYAR